METKVKTAFDQGGVDCSPIYIGYCEVDSSYWFYIIKQGVPRFLKYVSYFYLDRGPQQVLSLKPLPTEVESELKLYLEGTLGYEFKKKRKNSREVSACRIFRTALGCDSNDGESRNNEGGSGESSTGRKRRSGTGRGVTFDTSARGSSETGEHGGRRRSGRSGLQMPVTGSTQGSVSTPTVEIKPEVEKVLPAPKELKPKVKKLLKKREDVKIPVAASSSTIGTRKKRNNDTSANPKPAETRGLELGVVGLLTEKRKRGRPKKAA